MDTGRVRWLIRQAAFVAAVTVVSQTAVAQVFDTGVNSVVAWALTIATPVAVLVVIAAGGAAAIGKISWGWVIGLLIGIGVIFGSEQIVTWIRGLFGV
jgi:type IV secretion system protein VirB2